MHWLSLPESRKTLVLGFSDTASASTWLTSQTPGLPMLEALGQQVEALDAAALPPILTIELLDLLRSAAIPLQANIEARYMRKALPMKAEDLRSFNAVQQLWTWLGIAYLRLALDQPAATKSLPLNRAACALRIAEHCHFQAACECPAVLEQLLFAVLAEAGKFDLLHQPLTDSDFPHLGAADIAGHLVWAFLLHLIGPYHLTASQLIVANRAISRWRELCVFQFELDANPKTQAVDLSRLFGAPLPAGIPQWLNVRKLARKAHQRIEALQEGQSPEALKLGRELSAAACIRLFNQLLASLRPQPRATENETGDISLSFKAEDAYAIFRGALLNPAASTAPKRASLAHQRIEMFGFDRLSQMPTAVKTLNIPGEIWRMVDGKAIRPAAQSGARHLSPCLVSTKQHGRPRLGVMLGLQTTAAGDLQAQLKWYPATIEAGWLLQREPKTPAFLLHHDQSVSLIVPASVGVRLGIDIALAETSITSLVPTEVEERGIDFVRYACRLA